MKTPFPICVYREKKEKKDVVTGVTGYSGSGWL
jgi:hypothetical protein